MLGMNKAKTLPARLGLISQMLSPKVMKYNELSLLKKYDEITEDEWSCYMENCVL